MNRRALYLILLLLLCFLVNAQQPKLLVPIGHTKDINSACYSPDGKYIVTSSDDHTANIWNASRGTFLKQLIHSQEVYSAKFNSTGKRIVTTCKDGIARLWNAETGILIKELNDKKTQISFADFNANRSIVTVSVKGTSIFNEDGLLVKSLKSTTNFDDLECLTRDGKYFLTNTKGETIKVRDLESGKIISELNGDTSQVRIARFSANGKNIITVSNYNTIKFWDALSGKQSKEIKDTGNIYSIDHSPDGNYFVTSCGSDGVKIRKGSDGSLFKKLTTNAYWGGNAIYSPDGKNILLINGDRGNICNIDNEKITVQLRGYTKRIMSVNYSPDGENFVLASWGNYAQIWDVAHHKLIHSLRSEVPLCDYAAYSPDGKYIVTRSADTAEIRSSYDGNLIATIGGCDDYSHPPVFSPDGKYLASAYSSNMQPNKTVRIWESATGNFVRDFDYGEQDAAFLFSPNGKYLVAFPGGEDLLSTADSSFILIWKMDTGELVEKIKADGEEHCSVAYSPDGKYIVFVSGSLFESFVRIWDVLNHKLVKKFELNEARSVVYSPDSQVFVIKGSNNMLNMWNNKGERIKVFKDNDKEGLISLAVFCPDGKYIASASSKENDIKVWETSTGKLINIFKSHLSPIHTILFDRTGETFLSVSDDYTIKKWNMKTGKLIYTFFDVDNDNYITQIPSGYYMCSPSATKYLHYIDGLQLISFEQLDIKYNRPDKVLEAIGITDTAVIKSYKRAYEKRIKKLNIDTTSFNNGYNVPQSDFTDRDMIKYEQTGNKLSLRVHAFDSVYSLQKINILINEVPLFGSRGINISINKKRSFDTTVTITLSDGDNRIETSVLNSIGIENYRTPLYVKFIPPAPAKKKTWFIGIGTNNFKDKRYDLQWSVKDITDLSRRRKFAEISDTIIIDTLFNENVTISNVKALKNKLLKTTENDVVIIAYSGHGLLSTRYDYYLSTYDVNFSNPEENGLPYEELESLLDSIPSRKKLMLIDACHSGEVDKDDLNKMILVQKELDPSKKGAVELIDTTNKTVGMKNSFELMQELFANVSKSTGATIISAASGTQFALERNDLKNGVFTYSILEAMNQNQSIMVSKLRQLISERILQLTNGQQMPTSRNETLEFDWKLW